jgi:hypothetical protein
VVGGGEGEGRGREDICKSGKGPQVLFCSNIMQKLGAGTFSLPLQQPTEDSLNYCQTNCHHNCYYELLCSFIWLDQARTVELVVAGAT